MMIADVDVERKRGLKKFERRTMPLNDNPFIGIQREGRTMTLNKIGYGLLGEPEAVELFYGEEGVIGLRAASKDDPSAFSVRGQGKKGEEPSNYVIAALAFTKHNDIDVSIARRYPAQMEGDFLIAELDRGVDATGPRLKKDS